MMKWETIQKHVGVTPDGKPGARTAAAVAKALGIADESQAFTPIGEGVRFDSRSELHLNSLHPAVRPVFRGFLKAAKKIAAEEGADVRIINGHRSFEEQNDLYAQGRSKPGKIVTNARGGDSWHNYKIAVDLGLFDEGTYLDGEQPHRASKIYKRIAALPGRTLFLEWGGDWKSFVDEPHFHFKTGLTMAQARKRVAQGGAIV